MLHFNGEGGKIFADVTRANVDRRLMIFLDGDVSRRLLLMSRLLVARHRYRGTLRWNQRKSWWTD